jgi:hypothetical protein
MLGSAGGGAGVNSVGSGSVTSNEASLTPAEVRDLRRIAGLMIPASEEHGVPGADDPVIFNDILSSLGRDLGDVRAALKELAALADGAFADVNAARAEGVAEAFGAVPSAAAVVLGRVILQCYYRDDRVLVSLGLEPRPPFPKGHTLEQGDWSLLDAVRGRPQLWRDDRKQANKANQNAEE